MPRINLPEGLTGMAQLRAYRPDVSARLGPLAGLLLQPTDTLSCGDRELIATFVSSLNSCNFCQLTHGKAAAQQLGDDEQLIEDVKCNYQKSRASPKIKALLAIAEQVQQGGTYVTPEAIKHACTIGATEMDVHDTILIAAAFCMFNRYIGGLDVSMPSELTAELRPQIPVVAKSENEETSIDPSPSAQTTEPTPQTPTTVDSGHQGETIEPQTSEVDPSDSAKDSLPQEVIATSQNEAKPEQPAISNTSTYSHPPPPSDDTLKSLPADTNPSHPPPPAIEPLNIATTTSPPTKEPHPVTNTFTAAQRQEMINIIQQVVAAAIQAQPASPTSPEVSNQEKKSTFEERTVEIPAFEVK